MRAWDMDSEYAPALYHMNHQGQGRESVAFRRGGAVLKFHDEDSYSLDPRCQND